MKSFNHIQRVAAAVVCAAAAQLPAWANDAPVPAALQELNCEAQRQPGERTRFTCPIKTTGAPQNIRLVASFIGSHDDTELSMLATLDGAAVVCQAGSKTESTYEDGDVSLHCGFQFTAAAGNTAVLSIQLNHYHAQPDTMDFAGN